MSIFFFLICNLFINLAQLSVKIMFINKMRSAVVCEPHYVIVIQVLQKKVECTLLRSFKYLTATDRCL